ncbi:hypothetical protein [Okeania sp.]|nr:hypothetical protein [Okeania sp.]MEB3340988.1 hypothetical protein [Okeania sp.]
MNKVFDSLEQLKQVICDRCCQLVKQPEILRAITQFHWWPSTIICNV